MDPISYFTVQVGPHLKISLKVIWEEKEQYKIFGKSGGGKKTQIMGFCCLTRKRCHANEIKPVSVLLAHVGSLIVLMC